MLSATIHPDIKRTLVAMSERTGMSVSQVTDEVPVHWIDCDAGALRGGWNALAPPINT